MDKQKESRRLNWQQACQVLGCGKTYFYSLVASGALTGYRVGQRGLWVYEDDCKRLLQRHSKKSRRQGGKNA